MKNILDNNNSTNDAKDDIEGIKADIAKLTHRLGNIKDNAGDIIAEQIEHLSTAISQLKDKGMGHGRDGVAQICNSTRKHPLRNLMYAFGAGVVIAYFIKD